MKNKKERKKLEEEEMSFLSKNSKRLKKRNKFFRLIKKSYLLGYR